MKTKVFEAESDGGNWGKFLVIRLDKEWNTPSMVDVGHPISHGRGWAREHLWVMDLETGEGAMFRPDPKFTGAARSQLNKHRIWVCVLFEPFLTWLFQQDLTDLQALPQLVKMTGVPLQAYGYRRPGPQGEGEEQRA